MFFFLGEDIGSPSSSLVGSLFFGKKAKENNKKKVKNSTHSRKKKRETFTAHTLSFFPSLSVLLDIKYTRTHAHARETREE